MHSVTRVFAIVVLLTGFSAAIARTQVVDREVPTVGRAEALGSAAVPNARRVNAADALQTGKPAAASSSPATYIDSKKVAASYPKDGSVELFGPGLYKRGEKTVFNVHVNRHDKPMDPQYHIYNTHIMYVLDGSATYVFGGTLVGLKPFVPDPHLPNRTADNAVTGTSIEGGETRHLSKGDVVIVPARTPHWFKEIQSPVSYLEVNVF